MKRRLLPALLALVMVLSLLPVAAFAADAAVKYINVVKAPLEDHNPIAAARIEKLYDSYTITPAKTSNDTDAIETYDVKVTATNLRQHYNVDDPEALAFWAGIAVPHETGAKYDWGWGYYNTVGELEEAGDDHFTSSDGKLYQSFYFPLEANGNETDTAYVVVDRAGNGAGIDVIYNIDFTSTTLAVPFTAGWELGAVTNEDGDVTGAKGAKWEAKLGDWRTTTEGLNMGAGVASEDLNTDGYIVCAEAGKTNGNEYDVKVLHDGLRVHANGDTPNKLGWWVGVTFPVSDSYEIVSWKSDAKTYTKEDWEGDIANEEFGGPTLYFDLADGTSRTVEIGYKLDKETNYYKDTTVTVKYNIDLSGVTVLDGVEDENYTTTIDYGTILKQERAAGKTVTNSICSARAQLKFEDVDTGEEIDWTATIGSAVLPTEPDDVLTAIGKADYELEVAGVGKVKLYNDAVTSIKANVTEHEGDRAEISMASVGSYKLKDDLDTTLTYTGTMFGTKIIAGADWDIPVKDGYKTRYYTEKVEYDFGTDEDFAKLTYADLLKVLDSAKITVVEPDAVPAANVDLSFYAGTGLRLSNITVVGVEPAVIEVTNTNAAATSDHKTVTIDKDADGGDLEILALYDSSDELEYDSSTGYVTLKNARYLGDYLVVVSTSTSGGGAASGGSSSGSTTTPGGTAPTTPAQTVVKETVSSTTTGTAASANVTSATMDKAVNSAVSQAKKAGNTPVVEINVTVGATAESLEVTLPTASLGKLAETDGSELVISSTIATVELDHTALAALVAEAGENASVKLEVALIDPDDLTGAQAEAFEAINTLLSETEVDAEIVDVSLLTGDEAVHNYNNGSISVTMPFALPTGATASDVRVYYLDDEGALTRCTASYTDGKVTFVTNHLSKYIISAKALLPEANFTDVPESEYYFDAVAWAVANGVTTGKTDTIFDPNDGCTRAQIVTFLWRAYGEPEATADVNFTDVDANEYYYDAVKWAVANGITTGTGDGSTFSPNQVCTRAEAVTFQKRAAGMNTMQGTASDTFTDVEAGAFYDNAVLWAVTNGITTGTTATTFSPYDFCTRAQIVTFLYRQFGN